MICKFKNFFIIFPDPIKKLYISEEQKEYALKLSQAIYNDKIQNGFKDRAVILKKLGKNTSKLIEFIGFLGETIFADNFNLNRPVLFSNSVDEGFDFKINKLQIELKVSLPTRKKPHLIIYKEHLKKPSNYFVLMQYFKTYFIVIGGISKEDFKEKKYVRDFGYGDRFCVSAKDLESFP